MSEVTDGLEGCRLNGSAIEYIDSEDEEIVEGCVVGGADSNKVEAVDERSEAGGEMAGDEVDFEVENGADGAKALEFTRTLKIEYDPSEVAFWFTQIENEMYTCEVRSQWLKRCVLVKNLPPKVQADVKSLLTLKKSEAPEDLYKQIKDEILRIHAPREEQNFKKALSRVLVGLPSQLGQQLINDVCDKSPKLACGCCSKVIYTLWCLQLPDSVRSHISNMKFDKDTYPQVFQAADNVFLSTKRTEMSASVAAVVTSPVEAGSDEVAAVSARGRGRGGRRPFRGGRGNRGNRGGRGGGQSSGTSAGGGNNNSSGGNNNNSGGNQSRGTRHSSNPPSSCCDSHYRYGDKSWNCLSPFTCPWKDKCTPRPTKKNKNQNQQ